MLIRYEEMHSKPTEVLESVMGFLNAGEVDQVVLDAAVSYGSFNRMRKMEEKNAFGDSMLRPGTENDNDSYKVRRGKIGGFVDYFSKEDLSYIDETVSTMGLKECDWYYAAESHRADTGFIHQHLKDGRRPPVEPTSRFSSPVFIQPIP